MLGALVENGEYARGAQHLNTCLVKCSANPDRLVASSSLNTKAHVISKHILPDWLLRLSMFSWNFGRHSLTCWAIRFRHLSINWRFGLDLCFCLVNIKRPNVNCSQRGCNRGHLTTECYKLHFTLLPRGRTHHCVFVFVVCRWCTPLQQNPFP